MVMSPFVDERKVPSNAAERRRVCSAIDLEVFNVTVVLLLVLVK